MTSKADSTQTLSERVALAMGWKNIIKRPSTLFLYQGGAWVSGRHPDGSRRTLPDFEHDPRTQDEMLAWLDSKLDRYGSIWLNWNHIMTKWTATTGWNDGQADDIERAEGPTINEALCNLILEVAK